MSTPSDPRNGTAAVPGGGARRGARVASKAEDAAVLVDRIGERLAFERTATRLYEALVTKFETIDDGPTLDEVRKIHDDELRHFEMLSRTLGELGADPTVVTPSAALAGALSIGLPQVMNDPRTRFAQCLEVALVVELVDNDGWTLLADLADEIGEEDLADRFRDALDEENEHLTKVRDWVWAALRRPPEAAMPSAH